jgi:hypothetical protein
MTMRMVVYHHHARMDSTTTKSSSGEPVGIIFIKLDQNRK